MARFGVVKVKVVNRKAVPTKGNQVILAASHLSYLDPVVLWGALRRSGVAIAMAELWRLPLLNILLNFMGHIPIKRGDAESAQRMHSSAVRELKNHGLVMIFPEGKISKTGKLLPFKFGVIKLAFETMTPVLPVGIQGTNAVLPLGSKWLRRRNKMYVVFGELMNPQNYLDAAQGNEKEAKQAFMNDLWGRVLELSTTDYSKKAAA